MHEQTDIHQKLYEAITSHNPKLVKQCLDNGANPNHHYETPYPDPHIQPDSPLKLVVFCISDSFVDEDGHSDFKEIAELLINAGAEPAPATEMAKVRYGDPENWGDWVFGAVLEVFC